MKSKNISVKQSLRFLAFVTTFCIFSSCQKENSDSPETKDRKTIMPLTPSAGNSIGGSATIEENKDHSFNVKIDLTNTMKDSVIYIDMHNGSFQDPFQRQAVDLGSIIGTGGSASNVTSNIKWVTLPDLSRVRFSYDSILNFKGFINISSSYSVHRVSTAIAHVTIK